MYPGVSVRPRLYKPAPGLLRGIVSVRQNVFLFWLVEHIRIFFKTVIIPLFLWRNTFCRKETSWRKNGDGLVKVDDASFS